MKKYQKGFTLIELLVVIAIIGILAGVVLTSLNTARAKARDAQDISNLKSVQLALELYADDNGGSYPTADATCDGVTTFYGLQVLISDGYIPVLPADSGACLVKYSTEAGDKDYHIGINLEDPKNSVLDTDNDTNSSATPPWVGVTFNGASDDCVDTAAAAAGAETCYDIASKQ